MLPFLAGSFLEGGLVMVRANHAAVYGGALLGAVVLGGTLTLGQQPAAAPAGMAPTNDAPNPYQTIEGHFKLPEGRFMQDPVYVLRRTTLKAKFGEHPFHALR